MILTHDQYRAYVRSGKLPDAPRRQLQRPRRGKYNNTPTVVDGVRFDSKLEARTYEVLLDLKARGKVTGFLRQPMFDTGGGTRYRGDFLVFFPPTSDNSFDRQARVEVWDCKGYETAAFKRARKQVEAAYPEFAPIILIKQPSDAILRATL